VTYDRVTIYWLPSNGTITQCGHKVHAIEAGRTSRVQQEVHYEQSVNWRQSWINTVSNSNKIIGLDNLYNEMAEYLGEEIHCSHCNDLEDNMFHGVGDRRHPGFSRMVLESLSPSPSPIIRTRVSSSVSQDLLQPSSPSTESGVLGDSSRVEDTSPASTPPPLEEVHTGDKDQNTHQAHAGYIGSTDNK